MIQGRHFKIILRAATAAVLLVLISLLRVVYANDYTGERITYEVSLLGNAEYSDMGIVELEGKKARLVNFRTRVIGLDDLEKIYCDPVTLLPLRVERDISFPFNKEYLVEIYDTRNFSLVIKKYVDNKEVKEYRFKAEGPIYNAVLFPFYLRTIPKLELGQSFEARFPEVFKISLVSIDEIEVPAGKFKAYHFTSQPHKFEIWISQDKDRIPLKIKDTAGLGYTLLLKNRTFNKK